MGSGLPAKRVEREQTSSLMETPMWVSIQRESPMDRGYTIGRMEASMRGYSKMGWSMVRACGARIERNYKAIDMWDNTRMIRRMGMGSSLGSRGMSTRGITCRTRGRDTERCTSWTGLSTRGTGREDCRRGKRSWYCRMGIRRRGSSITIYSMGRTVLGETRGSQVEAANRNRAQIIRTAAVGCRDSIPRIILH